MIQPAHLRVSAKMARIGIFSVDEHAEGVSLELGVDVFAVLSHEGFPSGGGELADGILVEGLSFRGGEVQMWSKLDDQRGSVLHDYLASVDGPVGDQTNAFAGDLTDFEWRWFGIRLGERGVGIEDVDIFGSADEDEAIANVRVGKVAILFDALADFPWFWNLDIVRCCHDL